MNDENSIDVDPVLDVDLDFDRVNIGGRKS
jgi:hypothetical protein